MIYKFTAKWCSSCLITNQNFGKLIQDYKTLETDINYQEIDVDSELESDLDLLKQYKIDENSVLPILVFTNNQNTETERLIGEKNRQELIISIDKYLLENQNKASPSSQFQKPSSDFFSSLKNIFK